MSLFAIFYQGALALGHAAVPPTAGNISQFLDHNMITGMVAHASTLEHLSKYSWAVERLSKLQYVGYAGGPLHKDIGIFIMPKLKNFVGGIRATEIEWFHIVMGGSEKWDCGRSFSGVGYRFDEISEGLFEYVLFGAWRLTNFIVFSISFDFFPTIDECRTQDIYALAPSFLGWLRYQGRLDDLIIYPTARRSVLYLLKISFGGHSSVKAALLVGEFRFAPSLLIELQESCQSKTKGEDQEILELIYGQPCKKRTRSPPPTPRLQNP